MICDFQLRCKSFLKCSRNHTIHCQLKSHPTTNRPTNHHKSHTAQHTQSTHPPADALLLHTDARRPLPAGCRLLATAHCHLLTAHRPIHAAHHTDTASHVASQTIITSFAATRCRSSCRTRLAHHCPLRTTARRKLHAIAHYRPALHSPAPLARRQDLPTSIH